MKLTVGPNPFFWKSEAWAAFYDSLAKAPVDHVALGEVVCSKRLPFYQNTLPEAIAALQEAGKTVALTSLALVTLKRERKMTAELFEVGVEVEVNDLTALADLPKDTPFSIGPLVMSITKARCDGLPSVGPREFACHRNYRLNPSQPWPPLPASLA
ncbi:hypothetical protein AB9F29_17975 [Falsihalocynthiibacter sp. S25ZX9]|uniref:hypothetical protein n=1 Tax=Falsihalocynthiibacter sp. S25ZX9 TaxID=3240870 RepID=UPI00350F7800